MSGSANGMCTAMAVTQMWCLLGGASHAIRGGAAELSDLKPVAADTHPCQLGEKLVV